jgi:glucosylceramidase
VGAATGEGWVTVAGDSSGMRPLAVDVRLASPTDSPPVTVDARLRFQRVDGFGAAVTHTSAELIGGLSQEARDRLMAELFDPGGSVRLTSLRIPIGASDFISGEAFTHDDMPPGQQDWTLDHFNIDHDRATILPVLSQALALNPDLVVTASPWSPPAWLKTSGSLVGGRLLDDAAAYEVYAAYLVRFVQAYQRAGIPIGALTVQNEPQLRHPDGYPGTDLPVGQEARLVEALGPQLRAAGLSTRILGFDHNWSLHPADAAATPAGEDPAYDYAADLLRTPAARWLAGTAVHCYSGSAARQAELHDAFPDKGIWITECSGSKGPDDSPEATFANTLAWMSQNLFFDGLGNWAQGVLTWNLALDDEGGPHNGGCSNCTGVVTIRADGSVIRNAEYFLLAQAARAAPPGAIRIGSDSDASTSWPLVAFEDPSGATSVLVYNTAGDPRPLAIGDGRALVTATVPGRSLATLVWHS